MQRGGRRDDARKKAMERLDWLLEWITARQGVAVTFYGERLGNLVYTELASAAFTAAFRAAK